MRTATKLTLVLGAALAALTLGGPASAHRRTNGPIVMRAVAVPTFVNATSACAAFSVQERVVSPAGAPLGWSEFCLATSSMDATGGYHDTGTATFHLRGGMIQATLTLVEVPTPTGVVQTDTGTIFRGTRRYRGATGSLSGGGPIVFDATGTPHPDLTLTLTRDRARGVPINAVDSGTAVVVATAGSVIQTADTGTGCATHLGRFGLVAGEHVDLATGMITGGFYTLTARHPPPHRAHLLRCRHRVDLVAPLARTRQDD